MISHYDFQQGISETLLRGTLCSASIPTAMGYYFLSEDAATLTFTSAVKSRRSLGDDQIRSTRIVGVPQISSVPAAQQMTSSVKLVVNLLVLQKRMEIFEFARISTNMRALNKAVKKSVFMIPTFDKLVAQFKGS